MAETTKDVWGFSKKDLDQHGVKLLLDVSFTWNEDTPEELRQAFGEAAHVLQYVAREAVMRQLAVDDMLPSGVRHIFYGNNIDKAVEILRDSGWVENRTE